MMTVNRTRFKNGMTMTQTAELIKQLRQGSLSNDDYRWEAADRIAQLEAEVKVWQGHAKTAIWSDSEECKVLTRINEALIAAPTVDIDVVVPDRDYSAMTPKDCYEAGLLDGVYQAREAIKAAARAALAAPSHASGVDSGAMEERT